jgi:hypothetical protein
VITDTSTGARFHPSAQGRDHVILDGSMEKVLGQRRQERRILLRGQLLVPDGHCRVEGLVSFRARGGSNPSSDTKASKALTARWFSWARPAFWSRACSEPGR